MQKPDTYFHTFQRDGHEFIVRSRTEGEGRPFLGYHNGELSVEADGPDIACRALVLKHVVGLPAGELIDLGAARAARSEKAAS